MNHGLIYLLRRLKHHVLPSRQAKRMKPWLATEGDKTLRQEYDLNSESIVFDLGGFEGNWSSDIFSRFLCKIYIFEPVPSYCEKIRKRFLKNPRISVHNYGLSNSNMEVSLSMSGDSSSLYKTESKSLVHVQLKNVVEVMENLGIDKIDLMKINIEGGEYELLEFLTQTPSINNIQNIQIQFHDFVPRAKERMENIKGLLSRTHELTYEYEFVWENWKLK